LREEEEEEEEEREEAAAEIINKLSLQLLMEVLASTIHVQYLNLELTPQMITKRSGAPARTYSRTLYCLSKRFMLIESGGTSIDVSAELPLS
jgi:hypothetical protein